MSTNLDYLYYCEPTISLKSFFEIMLASLADKLENNIAFLPINYKDVIRNLLYNNEERLVEFSKIININEYYYNNLKWEKELDKEKELYLIKNYCRVNNQTLEIAFNEEDIENIYFNYDEETLEIMDHFADLFIEQIESEKINNLSNNINNLKIKTRRYETLLSG